MTETIFSPSFGNRPSYLVGRGNVISTFISGLEQEPGNRDRAMLMLGSEAAARRFFCGNLPTAHASSVLLSPHPP